MTATNRMTNISHLFELCLQPRPTQLPDEKRFLPFAPVATGAGSAAVWLRPSVAAAEIGAGPSLRAAFSVYLMNSN